MYNVYFDSSTRRVLVIFCIAQPCQLITFYANNTNVPFVTQRLTVALKVFTTFAIYANESINQWFL